MVKCSSIKEQLTEQIQPIYDDAITAILAEILQPKTHSNPRGYVDNKDRRGRQTRDAIMKRVGSLGDVISNICIGIEMTTEHMGKPGIWLDEYGRLKRNIVVETIQERYETYEKRLEAEWEFDIEARCNMPRDTQ